MERHCERNWRREWDRRDEIIKYWASSSRKSRVFYFGWALRITCYRQPLLFESHSVVPTGIVDRSLAIVSRYLDDLLNRCVAIYGNRWQSIFIDIEKWQAFLSVTPRYIHRLKRTCILERLEWKRKINCRDLIRNLYLLQPKNHVDLYINWESPESHLSRNSSQNISS